MWKRRSTRRSTVRAPPPRAPQDRRRATRTVAPRARSSAPPLKSLRRVVELLEALERREGELLARAKGMTAVKNALLDSHRFKLECSIEALSGVVEEVVKPVSVKDT